MDSPRDVLQQELERRVALNPAYSLGAFAKSLNYDKAALSRIMSGKRQIGPRTLVRLSKQLHFHISTEVSNDPELNFERLSDDVFASIQGFEHFAILELMQTKGFKSEVPWIAKALSLSTLKVRAAIERLTRLGMIAKNKSGEFVEIGTGWTTSIHPDRTDEGRKTLQRELLQKAQIALDTLPLSKRDHSSITFSMNDAQLAKAKVMIAKFRRKLAKELSTGNMSSTKNAVYNLSISFFPLTANQSLE